MKKKAKPKNSDNIHQTINIHGGNQNITGKTKHQYFDAKTPTDEKHPSAPKKWYEKWVVTAIGVGIVTFLLVWWLSTDLKIGVIGGGLAFVFMLLNNPDRWIIRLAQSALAACIGTVYLNFNIALQHKAENGTFDIQFSDPPAILSLALLVFALGCVLAEVWRTKE